MPAATRAPRKKVRSAARVPGKAAKLNGISTAAVERATGKGWDRWIGILDRAGAAAMSHQEIVALLDGHGIGGWWCQMVTVGYEQARGKRVKHQRLDGFEINASKTVGVPVAVLYRAWSDTRRRERWLRGAEIEIRRATRGKSMRITWEPSRGEAATHLDVNFLAKSGGRSQVAIGHGRLKTPAAGKRMKAYWAGRLDALREMLEA